MFTEQCSEDNISTRTTRPIPFKYSFGTLLTKIHHPPAYNSLSDTGLLFNNLIDLYFGQSDSRSCMMPQTCVHSFFQLVTDSAKRRRSSFWLPVIGSQMTSLPGTISVFCHVPCDAHRYNDVQHHASCAKIVLTSTRQVRLLWIIHSFLYSLFSLDGSFEVISQNYPLTSGRIISIIVLMISP